MAVKKAKVMQKTADPKYKTYAANKKAKGYKKIHPWIPIERDEQVKRYIARIVKKFEQEKA